MLARSGYRVLREIKERLVCRKCGHKPLSVALSHRAPRPRLAVDGDDGDSSRRLC